MEQTIIEDTEEASFLLNGMLAGVDENTSAYMFKIGTFVYFFPVYLSNIY